MMAARPGKISELEANTGLKVAAASESPRIPPLNWMELRGEPPPRTWWIQDWLGPWPGLTAGPGGAGKTKLWQAICTSLASARPYLDAVAQPLKSLMWACEDDANEAWRTQGAINAHLESTMADIKDRFYLVPRFGCENTILSLSFGTPSFTRVFAELEEQVNDLKVDLLVLDNVAQVFGGNENDRHQVTMFVNGIAGMVRDRPFAPIFLAHPARSQGSEYAGSAAWENAVRMRWFLGHTLPDQKPSEEEEGRDSDVVYLARRKANYTGKDWRRLRFRNGLFVPDEVPQAAGRRFDQAFRDSAAEDVVLSAFPRLLAAGIQPSDSPNANDYLPKQIIAKGYAQNHSREDLAKAMNRLMGTSRLRREVVGKYPNRAQRYGLVIP